MAQLNKFRKRPILLIDKNYYDSLFKLRIIL